MALTIDVHVHPVARDMVRDTRNLRLLDRHAACLAPTAAVDRLLERMDRGGIAWSCLMGPAPGDGMALTNAMVREAVAARPDRLIGFVGVDPVTQGADVTRDVIARAVTDWGFRGVGELANVDLLDPQCEAVYETCSRLGVPLLVHLGVPLPSMLLKHGHPFALDEVAHRFPELQLIAAHVGMPWVVETVAVAARHDNVSIDISAITLFDERAAGPIVSLCVQRGLGERLLFGSDFPLVDPARYVQVVRRWQAGLLMRRLFRLPKLTRGQRDQVLGLNAAKLLRLAPVEGGAVP